MKVFKFGGAAVKNAEAIQNVAAILEKYKNNKVLLVISAMGNTTDMLEELCDFYMTRDKERLIDKFLKIKDYHLSVISDLFGNSAEIYHKLVEETFDVFWNSLYNPPTSDYNYEYDRVVSFGEIISTKIISAFLNFAGMSNKWLDARCVIKTDEHHRKADINWEETISYVKQSVKLFKKFDLLVTQGFIGSTSDNVITTLGREGSDYSAAVLSYCFNAECLVIWKDVAGIFNADPKYFPHAEKLDSIDYKEAIELAYCGANVIHPKTIKPLENKKIPLFVKSFLQPEATGSMVVDTTHTAVKIPSYILKSNQALLSISAKDFSFIAEQKLVFILNVFDRFKVGINMVQNASINFWVCIDNDHYRLKSIKIELEKEFYINCLTGLELITIRHYNEEIIKRTLCNNKPLLEQRSRHTAQFVVERYIGRTF